MSRRRALPEERGKIVKPPGRMSRFQWLSLVVIDQQHKSYWCEDGREGTDFADLLTGEPMLIAVDSSQRWADECTAQLQERYQAFNYVIAKTSRTEYVCAAEDDEEDEGLNIEYEVEHCSRWGLERKRLIAMGMKPTTGRYPWHYILDPANFFGYANLGCLVTTDNDAEDSLYTWAAGYREWCRSRDIRIALTKGSAASKVLRTCVQAAQYKVPVQTNARIRRHLCSSHIQTYTGFQEVIEHAVEYDQTGAYHACAQSVRMPDRDDFLARGDFHARQTTWFEPGDDEWNQLMYYELGLLCVRVDTWGEAAYRIRYPYSPWFPFLDRPMYLFTNELSLAKRCGLNITGIVAAWTSSERSSELATHAVVAQAELKAAEGTATMEWLKPLNLAVYGVAASTPHAIRKRTLREGDLKDSPVFETVTNHVAWLGMLQAEVRKRSIMLAMDLTEAGARVATIYADAVFAEIGNLDIDGIIPRYFRKRHHTNFRARKNVLCTDQTLKMPGTPKADEARIEKADAFLSA
jgi:hypothetical protein